MLPIINRDKATKLSKTWALTSQQVFWTNIPSHQKTLFTPHYHFFSENIEANSLSDYQLMMNSSTISSDRDKRDTVRQFGVVSHALSDVIVYFGVKQRTRRQNELAKITSTVLAASSLVSGPRFFFNVFTLNVYLPDSRFFVLHH